MESIILDTISIRKTRPLEFAHNQNFSKIHREKESYGGEKNSCLKPVQPYAQ